MSKILVPKTITRPYIKMKSSPVYFANILTVDYNAEKNNKASLLEYAYHQDVYFLLQSLFINIGVPKDVRNIILYYADIRVPLS